MFDDKIRCFDFGKYRLDVTNNELLRNNIPVSITQKSFDVLLYLIENRGRVLKKEEMLDALWEEDFVEESTLTQHIYMLRKALRQNGKGEMYIETLPKIGYRFVAEVSEIILQRPIKQRQPTHVYPDSKEIINDSIRSDIAYFNSLTESGKVSAYVKEKTKIAKKPKRISNRLLILAAILAIISISIFALSYFNQSATINDEVANSGEINKIAVLPFNQIDEEPDKKLGLGLADVLISKLSNLESISVLPTSAVISLAENENDDLFELGKKLNVDAILAGTIQRDEDQYRVTIHFYNVREKRPIFADRFDVRESNIFEIQDRIAEQVAQKLSLKMNVKDKTLPFTEFTNNRQAYQYYSMGLFHWNKRGTTNLAKAIEYFGLAIKEDPQFVHAYAYLADSYTLLGYYEAEDVSVRETLSKGRSMAQKAIDMDPNCSPALTALATVNIFENKKEKATELLKKAIELDPNNSTARVRLAWTYVYDGKLEKAIEEMKFAQVLDPLSKTTNLALAQLLNLARRPDESILYSQRVLEVESNSINAVTELANSFEQKKMFKEAIEQHKKILTIEKDNNFSRLALSRIYAKQNKKGESEKLLKEVLVKEKSGEITYSIALAHLALGEKNEALKWLKMYKGRMGFPSSYTHDYKLDALRDTSEFRELGKQIE